MLRVGVQNSSDLKLIDQISEGINRKLITEAIINFLV